MALSLFPFLAKGRGWQSEMVPVFEPLAKCLLLSIISPTVDLGFGSQLWHSWVWV